MQPLPDKRRYVLKWHLLEASLAIEILKIVIRNAVTGGTTQDVLGGVKKGRSNVLAPHSLQDGHTPENLHAALSAKSDGTDNPVMHFSN